MIFKKKKYDKSWDKKFNELMDKHRFVLGNNSFAHIGDYAVWMNKDEDSSYFPFCPAMKRRSKSYTVLNVKASESTIDRARRRLTDDFFLQTEMSIDDDNLVKELRSALEGHLTIDADILRIQMLLDKIKIELEE